MWRGGGWHIKELGNFVVEWWYLWIVLAFCTVVCCVAGCVTCSGVVLHVVRLCYMFWGCVARCEVVLYGCWVGLHSMEFCCTLWGCVARCEVVIVVYSLYYLLQTSCAKYAPPSKFHLVFPPWAEVGSGMDLFFSL